MVPAASNAFEPYLESHGYLSLLGREGMHCPQAIKFQAWKGPSFGKFTMTEARRGRQIWKFDGSVLARVQGPTQHDILAKLRVRWQGTAERKRLWPGQHL